MVLKYFCSEEFSRCTPACDIAECNEDALLMLDRLREYVGLPLILKKPVKQRACAPQRQMPGLCGRNSICNMIGSSCRRPSVASFGVPII